MRLPFTPEQFLAVFARYNESVWPMQVVLFAIGLLIAAFAWRRSMRPAYVRGALATLWLWMGVAYHVKFFAPINPVAYAFGAAFVLQAAIFLWHGTGTRNLDFAPPASPLARWTGWILVAYGLVAYPLVGMLAGQRYPALPTFGLPCPTVIFTLGVLAWAKRPLSWTLLVIPVAWTIVGTSAAMTLGIVEDFALIPAGGMLLWARHAGSSVVASTAK